MHPTVTIEDCLEAEEIVKADPGIIKLLRERYGLTPERVAFDPWYYGDRCARPPLERHLLLSRPLGGPAFRAAVSPSHREICRLHSPAMLHLLVYFITQVLDLPCKVAVPTRTP